MAAGVGKRMDICAFYSLKIIKTQFFIAKRVYNDRLQSTAGNAKQLLRHDCRRQEEL